MVDCGVRLFVSIEVFILIVILYRELSSKSSVLRHIRVFSFTFMQSNILQRHVIVPNIISNTPAMPMVASAAMHKLSGFFMRGTFLV